MRERGAPEQVERDEDLAREPGRLAAHLVHELARRRKTCRRVRHQLEERARRARKRGRRTGKRVAPLAALGRDGAVRLARLIEALDGPDADLAEHRHRAGDIRSRVGHLDDEERRGSVGRGERGEGRSRRAEDDRARRAWPAMGFPRRDERRSDGRAYGRERRASVGRRGASAATSVCECGSSVSCLSRIVREQVEEGERNAPCT